MKRVLAAIGIAVALSTCVPAVVTSAAAQGWRTRGEPPRATDADRGWRGQGNSGG